MTKKQEVIKRLNRFKTIKVLYGNIFAMHTEQLRILQEDIETALNIIKENSAEIQQKNTELAEKNAEIEKKDKIIDEMIGSFIDLGFGFKYCNNDDRCINDCDKCIKRYFESQV